VTEIVVDVVDRQRLLRLDAAWLTRVVCRALACEGVDRAEVCVLLVRDRRMAQLHDEWLGIPGPTDVITFDLGGGEPVSGMRGAGMRGDIAISTETAARAAREVGWAARHEVAYCVVHGLLHLAGYDDHAVADRRRMRQRERVLMAAAGLPRPPRRRIVRGAS
jgi:probable rRNA maturation factor